MARTRRSPAEAEPTAAPPLSPRRTTRQSAAPDGVQPSLPGTATRRTRATKPTVVDRAQGNAHMIPRSTAHTRAQQPRRLPVAGSKRGGRKSLPRQKKRKGNLPSPPAVTRVSRTRSRRDDGETEGTNGHVMHSSPASTDASTTGSGRDNEGADGADENVQFLSRNCAKKEDRVDYPPELRRRMAKHAFKYLEKSHPDLDFSWLSHLKDDKEKTGYHRPGDAKREGRTRDQRGPNQSLRPGQALEICHFRGCEHQFTIQESLQTVLPRKRDKRTLDATANLVPPKELKAGFNNFKSAYNRHHKGFHAEAPVPPLFLRKERKRK